MSSGLSLSNGLLNAMIFQAFAEAAFAGAQPSVTAAAASADCFANSRREMGGAVFMGGGNWFIARTINSYMESEKVSSMLDEKDLDPL